MVLIVVVVIGLAVGWLVQIARPDGYIAVALAGPFIWYGSGLLALAVVSWVAGALAKVGSSVRPLSGLVAGTLTWLAAIPGWWLFSRFELSINRGPGPNLTPTPLDVIALTLCAAALRWGMRAVRPAEASAPTMREHGQQEGREP